MIDIKTYLLDILSIREIGLQLRMLTIKRFYIWWCQRGVSKQKISYILVSESCQLRVIEWEGESSSIMGTRSIKIIEGATPISYHTIKVYYIATHLWQADEKCMIVNLNHTLMITLPCLHLQLINA